MSHAVFLDCVSKASTRGKSPSRGYFYLLLCGGSLEALLSVVKLAVSLVGLLFLHLGAPFRFVPPNNAATRCS